jgi:hypothetical protein
LRYEYVSNDPMPCTQITHKSSTKRGSTDARMYQCIPPLETHVIAKLCLDGLHAFSENESVIFPLPTAFVRALYILVGHTAVTSRPVTHERIRKHSFYRDRRRRATFKNFVQNTERGETPRRENRTCGVMRWGGGRGAFQRMRTVYGPHPLFPSGQHGLRRWLISARRRRAFTCFTARRRELTLRHCAHHLITVSHQARGSSHVGCWLNNASNFERNFWLKSQVRRYR